MFPREIVEKILSFSDGVTLLNARFVNSLWKDSVDYLSGHTSIWEYCCLEEIPRDELIEYLAKYQGGRDDEKYMNIYANWHDWKSIDENIDFEVVQCPIAMTKVTCVAVHDHYVAMGSELGQIQVFNDQWSPVFTDCSLMVRVVDLTFVQPERSLTRPIDRPYLLAFYKCATVQVFDYVHPWEMHDVAAFSASEEYLCFVTRQNVLKIGTLERDDQDRLFIRTLRTLRIPPANDVTGLRLWNGICTVVTGNVVRVLKYDDTVVCVRTLEFKAKLPFCDLKSLTREQIKCQIYRENLIISLTRDRCNDQLLEMFVLLDGRKKTKKTWETFRSTITCMLVYGNTFVIGSHVGSVYFYNIESWRSFDLKNYQHCEFVGSHPIVGVDVIESAGERKFWVVAGNVVHKVIGFTIAMKSR